MQGEAQKCFEKHLTADSWVRHATVALAESRLQ